jgi:TrmH family RNA methyltransferase
MPDIISSRSNPLAKQIRSLRQKKGRDNSGLFLVEGIHHVGEAVEAGWELETLIYSPDQLKSDFANHLIFEQRRRGCNCVAFSATLFANLAEKENPQGILAIVRQRYLNLGAAEAVAFRFGVALVSPQDPGNLGTIIRTLDAVGADGMFMLDGGVELYHPSVVRSSMGAIFWKQVFHATFTDFVEWSKKHDYYLIGSSAHARIDYRAAKNLPKPSIVVMGSEQKGLSSNQLANCDININIPMHGRASSLNLAVAAGILLFTLKEQIK